MVRHDVTVDPCPGEPFDLIHARFVLCHLPGRQQVLQRLAGWLKPGGCLLISYQDYGHWIRLILPRIKQEPNVYQNFTKDSFARFMRQLGMQIVMQRTGVQVTQVHRITSSLKLGMDFLALGDLKVRIPTPSYLLAVARKEMP